MSENGHWSEWYWARVKFELAGRRFYLRGGKNTHTHTHTTCCVIQSTRQGCNVSSPGCQWDNQWDHHKPITHFQNFHPYKSAREGSGKFSTGREKQRVAPQNGWTATKGLFFSHRVLIGSTLERERKSFPWAECRALCWCRLTATWHAVRRVWPAVCNKAGE